MQTDVLDCDLDWIHILKTFAHKNIVCKYVDYFESRSSVSMNTIIIVQLPKQHRSVQGPFS